MSLDPPTEEEISDEEETRQELELKQYEEKASESIKRLRLKKRGKEAVS